MTSNPSRFVMKDIAIDARRICAKLGNNEILHDISLALPSARWTSVVGPNGAGKSTLLKAIMGLEVRTGGRINCRIAGAMQELAHWETHRRAQAGIGYVAEDRRLFTGLTVRENLHIAASRDASAVEARVLGLFPALKTMLDRPAGQMSGGQQQMLAIGRTLMTDPKILLLDEPCEGIAPVLVASIRDALLELKRGGMALLVVEQNRQLAATADRLLLLVAGKVGHS